MIRAAIFDMDGLLIDSEPLWQRAEMELFSALGVPISPERCVETRGFRVGEVVAHWYRQYPWAGASPKDTSEELIERVAELIRREGIPLPGAIDAVRFTRDRCDLVGLASSSPPALIEATLGRMGIRSLFDKVHSAEQEVYGKPHPAVYLAVATALEVPPIECIALEDSLNGVLAAKAARMRCIAVPEENARQDLRFLIADARIDSLSSLDDVLWDRLTRSTA